MDIDDNNGEEKYCADDDTSRVYCNICDKFCIDRYYNNHLQSGTHNNNIHKKTTNKKYKH